MIAVIAKLWILHKSSISDGFTIYTESDFVQFNNLNSVKV